MKRVLIYLGMGSSVSGVRNRSASLNSAIKGIEFSPASTKTHTESPPSVMGQTPISVHTPATGAKGSKEEMFFDSKTWLDSEDEDDFVSVNGETSPVKQVNNDGEHQGRKLKELFLESSFGRDSQTSLKANAEAINKDEKPMTPKLERKKSDRSAQRCLPSLVRTLSCGDRKKRLRTSHISSCRVIV